GAVEQQDSVVQGQSAGTDKPAAAVALEPTRIPSSEPLALDARHLPGLAERNHSRLVQAYGADPWVIEHQGTFYYTQTTGRDIRVWTSSTFDGLSEAAPAIVWKPAF